MKFDEELMDLIDRAMEDNITRDEIISELELRLMALREEAAANPDDNNDNGEHEPA